MRTTDVKCTKYHVFKGVEKFASQYDALFLPFLHNTRLFSCVVYANSIMRLNVIIIHKCLKNSGYKSNTLFLNLVFLLFNFVCVLAKDVGLFA